MITSIAKAIHLIKALKGSHHLPEHLKVTRGKLFILAFDSVKRGQVWAPVEGPNDDLDLDVADLELRYCERQDELTEDRRHRAYLTSLYTL